MGNEGTAMKKTLAIVTGMACGLCAVSCGALSNLIDIAIPDDVNVRFVNNAVADVEVELRYSDDEDALKAFIQEFGDEVNQTVSAGSTATFRRDCDELRSMLIDNAALNLIGDIGPEADTDVLRLGDDFDCRDTVTFTFNSDALGVTLSIDTSVN